MAQSGLIDFIPGMKHGYGTANTVKLAGVFPGVAPSTGPTSAGAIKAYTVLDQYTVSQAFANARNSTNGTFAANLFSVAWYLQMSVTYSVAPSSLNTYLMLYQNVSATSGTATQLGGVLLATSPVNILGATTAYSYFTTTGSTNATATWSQTDLRSGSMQGVLPLMQGDTLSLVLNFVSTGGTITGCLVDGKANVDMETYSIRG